ncbi:MAG TPA: hypothetical protein VJ774_02600 [Actinomycetota bacterium]|nr:hypothetical protein [Actinomycetota bacterium]
MAWRNQRKAQRHAVVAALVGLAIVAAAGPLLLVPAIALVAVVYWSHHLASVLSGDQDVPYPNLAFVIVVNGSIVLLVQALVFAAHIDMF